MNLPEQAAFFSALADEARLAILRLLLEKERMQVREIERELGYTQTKTSRHLAYLRKSNLVKEVRLKDREGMNGRHIEYSINPTFLQKIKFCLDY